MGPTASARRATSGQVTGNQGDSATAVAEKACLAAEAIAPRFPREALPAPPSGLAVMPWSRRLAILEAVLILFPLTVLAVLGGLWSGWYLVWALVNLQYGLLTLLSAVPVAGLLGTIAGWRLLIGFIGRGPASLRGQSRLVWTGATLGAIAAIVGAGLALSGQGWIFAIGLPALIQLAHLWHERGHV